MDLHSDKLTALAVRMRKGERRAAAALYEELMPKAYGFFYTRTGKKETAEDLSQDIFLKLIEKIEMFDEKQGRFTVWFWRIARNLLVDHYRAKKEKPFSSFEDGEVENLSVARDINWDSRFQYKKLHEFLTGLGDDDREIFELRYVAGMSYGEMTELLGRSETALRVAALRLREKIKRGLQETP